MKMASLRFRGYPSRISAILFLCVAAVSVAALVWMGVRLLKAELPREAPQLQEGREGAADRLIASLEQVLSNEESQLADLPNVDFRPSADDVVLILAGSSVSSEVRVWPDNALLYYPVIPPRREAPSSLFAEAEKAEFLDHDYSRAVLDLLPFSKAGDSAAKIGAQFRLARNFRKAGNLESALKVYDEMARSSDQGVSLSGVPAGLAARRALCVLLEELGRRAELQQEAQSLCDDLRGRRWRLDRASYLYYRGQAAQWLSQAPGSDAGQQALADAVIWLWENRQAIAGVEGGPAGRKSFRLYGTPVTVLWRHSKEGLAAVVAGPGHQRSRWFDPLLGGADFSGVRVAIRDSDKALVFGSEPAAASPTASRLSSVTGLPL